MLGVVEGTTGMMNQPVSDQFNSKFNIRPSQDKYATLSNGVPDANQQLGAYPKQLNIDANEASVNDIGLVSNRLSGFNSANQTGKVIKVFDANGKYNGTVIASEVTRHNIN